MHRHEIQQNIIIYLYNFFSRALLPRENQGVTNLSPENESRPRDSDGLEKKHGNSAFNSYSLSQVASSLVW
jgi:hypothetical protein